MLVLTGLGLNCEAETGGAFRLVRRPPRAVHLLDLLEGGTALRGWPTSACSFIGGLRLRRPPRRGFRLCQQDPLAALRSAARVHRGRRAGPGHLQRVPDDGAPGHAARSRRRLPHAARHAGAQRPPGLPRRVGPPGLRRDSPCVWTRGLDRWNCPRATARASSSPRLRSSLERLEASHQVAARYVGPDGDPTQEWPHNPNGSPGAVAGVCDPSGRLFGLMPHPDAYLYDFHHPRWLVRRRAGATDERGEGEGLAIFRNGVDAAAAGSL